MMESNGRPMARSRRIPPRVRDRDVARVLVVTLGLNAFVAVLKLLFGALSGALSMVADGFHSLLDASSNVVGLIGLRISRKAPDADHPYGHRKFEALASLAIALFLFLACYEILTEVWSRFRQRPDMDPGPVAFLVMVLTMGVNVLVTRYESREGRRLSSMILLADAKHTRSDVFASLAVLVSLAAGALEFPVLDLVVAIAIAGFIAYSGYSVVASASAVLADAQVVDPAEVVALVTGVDGILHAHRVRSRGLADDVHVDLHIHVRPDMTVQEAHDLAHRASDTIKERIEGVTDVVVHVEPEGTHEG